MVDQTTPTIKEQQLTGLIEIGTAIMKDAADSDKHDIALDFFRSLQNRSGVRTTEFALSAICMVAGFGMQFWHGHEQAGVALSGLAAAAYALSRGMVKAALVK